MTRSRFKLATIALVTAGLAIGASRVAVAQATSNNFMKDPGDSYALGGLANNEGVSVESKSFKVTLGKANGDPAAAIANLGAREVSPGAIVFRHNDKLYMVEGTPQIPPQAMKDFQDNWSNYVKNFQDNWKSNMKDANATDDYKQTMKYLEDQWNISYMKNFQDQWKSNMTSTDFQDRWSNYMKNFQDDWKANLKSDASRQAMKDFQDNWNNYMKSFQDRWNVSYMSAMKDFQDNWSNYVR